MHDPNYVKMPNATHAIMQLNRLGYLRWHMKQLDTRIQISIEIRCSLNAAPSPVHARQMNDARMQAWGMLIEICPTTNQQKLISKREKEVVLEDMHSHARLLQHYALSQEGPNKQAKLY